MRSNLIFYNFTEIFFPRILLNKLDFPAFGGPTIAVSKYLLSSGDVTSNFFPSYGKNFSY